MTADQDTDQITVKLTIKLARWLPCWLFLYAVWLAIPLQELPRLHQWMIDRATRITLVKP